MAQTPIITADVVSNRAVSAVAKRLAHLTDFKYDNSTTDLRERFIGRVPTLKAADIQAIVNKMIAGHVLVVPHAGCTNPSTFMV